MALGLAFRAPTVGLDIGSGTVKAVALRHGRSGWSLLGATESPISHAGSSDEASDPVAVSEAIRRALQTLRMRNARVAAALSGHAVIVKRLTLPAMTQGELADAIPWEAEQYIPFDLADVQLDYQVVSEAANAHKNSLDVLLVAAKKERIEDRTSVIAQAGHQPVVLDVEAFALANAYQMNYPERADALTAIIHVGRRATIACLIEHGELVFTRDISMGGRLHAEALQRELGIDEAAAEKIQSGELPHGVSHEQASGVLREATSQLVIEIRKSIEFYVNKTSDPARASSPVEKLTRVVLSGGAWHADGLADLLEQELGAPVDVFDPFRRVIRPKRAPGPAQAAPAFAVAVGLAMRKEGDR